MNVTMILLPEMVALDLVGPHEVLSRVPGWQVRLVAASRAPVRADRGMTILPDCTRDEVTATDLLVIPGGAGADIAMLDPEWIAFVRAQVLQARYVFGICTGAFLLGAAGLLKGRRAGAHWQARDLLAQFGAIPVADRVVVDGQFYTSGGVTSGIDAALQVVADLAGVERARMIQLALEYDPAPPFPGGTPATSPQSIVDAVLEAGKARRQSREAQVARAARLL